MEPLIIEAGSKTPFISMKHDTGIIELKGKSIPENSVEFYQPVFKWLDEYTLSPNGKTAVTIHLEYFNTSSSKCLLDIFRKLEKLHGANNGVSILWLFEEDDEDMQEAGDDYQSIVKIPFTIQSVQ
jgi:SiaC family regulatory phosphoprotein